MSLYIIYVFNTIYCFLIILFYMYTGIIGYNDPIIPSCSNNNNNSNNNNSSSSNNSTWELDTLVRQILDEANCLRTTGANLVILIGG